MTDFFASLGDLIPDAESVGDFFDTTLESFGDLPSDLATGGGGGSGQGLNFRSSSEILSQLPSTDSFQEMALTEALQDLGSDSKPVRSEDPRRMQAEWLRRLRSFTFDEEE